MESFWADDPTRLMHVVVLAVFMFLATVAVMFRLWARNIQRSKLELNDYLCIVGLVFALGLSIFTIHSQVYWDLGGDPTQLGDPRAIYSLVIVQIKAVPVGEVLWIVSVAALRASILFLYSHIFRTKSFRMICYGLHVINFLYFATTILAACLICRPLSAAWNPRDGTCGNQKALDMYIGISNLLIDVAVVILPMPVLWRLQMSLNRKLLLSGIFGMGIIICIITLVRIWITTLINGRNDQMIYSLIALFTCLEASLGVISTCLPVMRPVFTKLADTPFFHNLSSSFPSASFSSFNFLRSSNRSSRSRNKNWPSKHDIAPRFVDPKAGRILFSHTSEESAVPRPPPKSKYYEPARPWEEKGNAIVVQRDWDVERGISSEEGGDRIPLNARQRNGQGGWNV